MTQSPLLHSRTFIVLLIAVSLAFLWLLWPFYGAVFWGTILAIIFSPLHRKLARGPWAPPQTGPPGGGGEGGGGGWGPAPRAEWSGGGGAPPLDRRPAAGRGA
ncbi:hypothetical protein LWS69_31930, partial [Bordetella hinzii]|nr:hypothetical protein [Bordetella hinzii]